MKRSNNLILPLKGKYILIILLSLTISCNNKSNNNLIDIPSEINLDSSLSLNKICDLSDSLKIYGVFNSFSFIDEDSFVVSSTNPAQVILYDLEGRQLLELGSKGNGPFEFISPSIVRSYKQNIYVWCSMKLKLIVFDKYGNRINEYSNFENAISDFEVYNNYVCFYMSGGFGKSIVRIFDLNEGEFIPQEFGEASNEHLILGAYECSGGLALSRNLLFFASRDEATVYSIDLNNFTEVKYCINDPEFKVEKVEEDHIKFMSDFGRSIKYIFGSDIIIGLICTDSFVVLKGEVGGTEVNGIQIIGNTQRTQKNYIFDEEMKLKYSVHAKINEGCSNCLYASLGEDIYTLKIGEDNATYELCKVNLFNGFSNNAPEEGHGDQLKLW